MNREELQFQINTQLNQKIQLVERTNGMIMISVPFKFPDGDSYSIYLNDIGGGKLRLSDCANTIMRLSYETPDVEKYFKGHRGELLYSILHEHDIMEDDGNFFVDVAIKDFSNGLFRLMQALTEIYDLSYLDRDRAQSTFYKDLSDVLNAIVKPRSIELRQRYLVPDVTHSKNYEIDYALLPSPDRSSIPLFLFGVPNADKAKLVTITLQHLIIEKYKMHSLLIFEEQSEITQKNYDRLINANVGGSQVSSIKSTQAIEQNIDYYFDFGVA